MSAPAARYWPHCVLAALIVIWSASYVVSKVALDALSPFALVAVRFWLAVLCVLPFARARVLGDLRRSCGAGIATGTALGAGYLLQMSGMTGTTASTGGLLAGLIVPLVALGGFLFFHARIGPRALLGLLLAIGGIVAICLPAGSGGAHDTLRGVLLQVGSSTAYAAHVLLLSHFGRSQPILAYSLWQLTFVAVAGTAIACADGSFAAHGHVTVEWNAQLLLAVAYLGVLATAVGIGLQSKVQHRIPPTPLALLFALQPLFAALFGWSFLDDRLAAVQFAGGAAIVFGVIVTSLDRPRARAAQ
jgi:drug/metabolite transporter (DMT)-like permease